MAEPLQQPPTQRSGGQNSLRDRSGYYACAVLVAALDLLDAGLFRAVALAVRVDFDGLGLLPFELLVRLELAQLEASDRLAGWIGWLARRAWAFDGDRFARHFSPEE